MEQAFVYKGDKSELHNKDVADRMKADEGWCDNPTEAKNPPKPESKAKKFTKPKILKAAKAAHAGNKAYCESIGDDSQPEWKDAPDWQKESALAGVQFHIDNPDAEDSASHDSWMAQKVVDGWVHGEEKDPEAKTHPCIVPFEDLPEDQQHKDKLFKETVWASLIPSEK